MLSTRTTVLAAVFVAALCGVASAAPFSGQRSTLYAVRGAPSDWVPFGSAEAEDPVTFIVALKQRNLERLDALFWRVSDPKSPQYQQYLTPDEINGLVRPDESAFRTVRQWLAEAGGVAEEETVDLGDAIEVRTTAAVASQLFATAFGRFMHNSGARLVRATAPYSVPREVADVIDMVAGLTEYPTPRNVIRRESRAADGASGNVYAIVPETLWTQYGIPQQATEGNHSHGVIEFEEQYFSQKQLVTFGKKVGLDIPKVQKDHVVGTNDQSAPGGESTLDIQWIAAIGLGGDSWFWIEGGSTWLYGFATHFLNAADVPEIVSISYGWFEGQQCQDGIGGATCERLGIDSRTYVQRTNTEFQKIGLRGVSILVASGDSGANGRSDGECTEKRLNPSYPAASPYVTAVGATQLVNTPELQNGNQLDACSNSGYGPCAASGTEQAVSYDVSEFASGGGFSNYAARPAYQADAVDAYLSSGVSLPPSSYYNGTFRGFPDVSAVGNQILVFQGDVEPVGGTSASTPIFAGVVSRLNVAAKAATGKTLGFLNPFLYQTAAQSPSAFIDVTVGDNKCTEDGCSGCKGFEAAAGWDPVTGLGSPSYPGLLAAVQALGK